MITPASIQAAITAIETGLEYIRDDLAAYKADPRYDSPKRVSYCVSRQEAEIAQMEAALDGLRKASASAAWADVADPDAWLENVRGTP